MDPPSPSVPTSPDTNSQFSIRIFNPTNKSTINNEKSLMTVIISSDSELLGLTLKHRLISFGNHSE